MGGGDGGVFPEEDRKKMEAAAQASGALPGGPSGGPSGPGAYGPSGGEYRPTGYGESAPPSYHDYAQKK